MVLAMAKTKKLIKSIRKEQRRRQIINNKLKANRKVFALLSYLIINGKDLYRYL